jgi:acetolactate synthase-1/3 small subunit
MMLIKLKAARPDREELKRLVEIFRAKIIDVTDVSYVVELTGASKKLDAFIMAVPEGLITEVVRSGPTGISRGEKGLTA